MQIKIVNKVLFAVLWSDELDCCRFVFAESRAFFSLTLVVCPEALFCQKILLSEALFPLTLSVCPEALFRQKILLSEAVFCPKTDARRQDSTFSRWHWQEYWQKEPARFIRWVSIELVLNWMRREYECDMTQVPIDEPRVSPLLRVGFGFCFLLLVFFVVGCYGLCLTE